MPLEYEAGEAAATSEASTDTVTTETTETVTDDKVVTDDAVMSLTDDDDGATDQDGSADDEAMSLTDDTDDKTSTDEEKDDDKTDDKADDKEGEDDEPIAYEDFDLPENVDTGMLEATTALFAKHKLSQEAAQEIISAYSEQIEAGLKTQQEAVADLHKQWAQDMKTDREFGGDNFAATAAGAKGVFKKYADEEMVTLMRETGLNKHPAILKTFAKISRDVLEDEVSDDPAISSNRSIVDDWYKPKK